MSLLATLKKANYFFHVWIGYGCAAFFIVLGLTGAVLVFEEEISHALHPDWHDLAIENVAPTQLPLDEIEKNVRTYFPDHQIAGFRLVHADGESLKADLMREGVFSTADIDPISGKILGHSSPS